MFLDTRDGSRQPGRFLVDRYEFQGVLTFGQGRLRIYDEAPLRLPSILCGTIQGMMHDQTRVTLVGCRWIEADGHGMTHGHRYHFAEVVAEFILLGEHHLDPGASEITAITVEPEDAAAIWHDPAAFSFSCAPSVVMDTIQKENQRAAVEEGENRATEMSGLAPLVGYFSGRNKILRAKTVLGTVTVEHRPLPRSNGSHGVRIDNRIFSRITFANPRNFEESFSALSAYLRFIEIIAGRRQGVRALFIEAQQEDLHTFDVLWSWPPKELDSDGPRSANPYDLPIQGALEAETFAIVMTNWLSRDVEWRDARLRYSDSFKHRDHSIDRLVAAANMFDLLPPAALPERPQLPKEMIAAQKAAKEIFRDLPDSLMRGRFLDALGRAARVTLKDKALHRARPVIEAVRGPAPGDSLLPDLALVIGCAID